MAYTFANPMGPSVPADPADKNSVALTLADNMNSTNVMPHYLTQCTFDGMCDQHFYMETIRVGTASETGIVRVKPLVLESDFLDQTYSAWIHPAFTRLNSFYMVDCDLEITFWAVKQERARLKLWYSWYPGIVLAPELDEKELRAQLKLISPNFGSISSGVERHVMDFEASEMHTTVLTGPKTTAIRTLPITGGDRDVTKHELRVHSHRLMSFRLGTLIVGLESRYDPGAIAPSEIDIMILGRLINVSTQEYHGPMAYKYDARSVNGYFGDTSDQDSSGKQA